MSTGLISFRAQRWNGVFDGPMQTPQLRVLKKYGTDGV